MKTLGDERVAVEDDNADQERAGAVAPGGAGIGVAGTTETVVDLEETRGDQQHADARRRRLAGERRDQGERGQEEKGDAHATDVARRGRHRYLSSRNQMFLKLSGSLGITVGLQLDRRCSVRLVAGRADVQGLALQLEIVLDQHAVVQRR